MGQLFSKNRNASEELEVIVDKLDKLHSRTLAVQSYRYNFLWWLTVICLFGSSVYSAIICAQDGQTKYPYVFLTWIIAAGILLIIRLVSVQLFEFVRRRDENKIQLLNEERSKIIERVKENEKFKVAKEIIEKYGSPEDQLELGSTKDPKGKPTSKQPPLNNLNEISTPANSDSSTNKSHAVVARQGIEATNQAFITPIVRRHPIRPYIQPSRTPIDKIIDYIIGDGPSNRFALICQSCKVHNGMALREEFYNISYICFNCGLLNPPKRSDRITPASRLSNQLFLKESPLNNPAIRTATNSESSDNESNDIPNDETLKKDENEVASPNESGSK